MSKAQDTIIIPYFKWLGLKSKVKKLAHDKQELIGMLEKAWNDIDKERRLHEPSGDLLTTYIKQSDKSAQLATTVEIRPSTGYVLRLPTHHMELDDLVRWLDKACQCATKALFISILDKSNIIENFEIQTSFENIYENLREYEKEDIRRRAILDYKKQN